MVLSHWGGGDVVVEKGYWKSGSWFFISAFDDYPVLLPVFSAWFLVLFPYPFFFLTIYFSPRGAIYHLVRIRMPNKGAGGTGPHQFFYFRADFSVVVSGAARSIMPSLPSSSGVGSHGIAT